MTVSEKTESATGMPSGTLPLSLIVFAYNESENVPVVLPTILRWLQDRGAPFELIFVDDGSTDNTRQAALRVLETVPQGKYIRHERNRGIGAALKSGVREATLPWVTFLPCDGQIDASELDILIDEAVRDDAKVVFSIYRDRDDGLHRKIFSAGIRGLIFALFRVRMRSDGPYLFARELFHPEQLPPDTFFLNFEFPIRCLRQGVHSGCVSISCRPRLAGQSKSVGWKRIYGVARDLVDMRARLWGLR